MKEKANVVPTKKLLQGLLSACAGIVVATICIFMILSLDKIVDHKPGQSDRAKKIDAAIIQLAQTQNKIVASVARLEYLTRQLSDDETMGEAIRSADKKWIEKVKVVNQQAKMIKVQQAEIQKLKAQIEGQTIPKVIETPPAEKGGTL